MRSKNRNETCSSPVCERPAFAHGWCSSHYKRFLSGGDPDLHTPIRAPAAATGCKVEGCERPHKTGGFCASHAERVRRGGSPGSVEILPSTRLGQQAPWVDKRTGYVYVQVEGCQVAQHRLVMEQVLGRALFPHERVHHKNSVRGDNAPDNLELWSGQHPTGGRVTDKIEWAKNFLVQYGYTVEAPI